MDDFNQPSPERIDLLKRLGEAIGDVPVHFWAACQICDVNELGRFLNDRHVLDFSSQVSQMIRHWGSSSGVRLQASTPRTPTPQRLIASDSGPSPPTLHPPSKRQRVLSSPLQLSRDANAKKRAEERDNYCCVLTGIELIEVAHIYPHHSMKHKEEDNLGPRHTFWRHLEFFWPEDKVATWRAKVFPDGIGEKGQEEVYNLISLAPHVHAMWGRGLFALKPISESDDKKMLTVQFFWQSKQKILSQKIPLTAQPHSTKDLEECTGAHGGPIWLHDKNKKLIRSGDSFELHTDDPINKPLPSFQLLELQWFLQRVQGMAGAVDVDWEEPWQYTDSESEYGIEEAPGLESNDDVEDFSLLSKDSQSSLANPDHPLYRKHVAAGVIGGEDGDREGTPKPNHPLYPKHVVAGVKGEGEGDEAEGSR